MTQDSRGFVTGALITVGALMVVLCGSCTAFWLGLPLWAIATNEGAELAPVVIMLALIIGGIPTLIGALMLRSGLRRRRAAKPPPSAPPPD